QGEQQGLLPLAVETAEADDLARSDLERDVGQLVLPPEPLDLERWRGTDGLGLRRILRRDVATDHQLHDLSGRTPALVEGLDVAPVPEHRGAVGQRLDLVHAMGDIENG